MTKPASKIISESLYEYGVPFAAGIPGHGNWALVDAFADTDKSPRFIQVMHEQSAAHMADACFRLTGKPGAVTGSIGPGAANTLMAMATAYSDSSAALIITGSAATNVVGHGVMQSLDRKYTPDFPRLAEPASKTAFYISKADMAPFIMHRAFSAMLTGRPGPAVVDVPLDVQVQTTDIEVQALEKRVAQGKPRADQQQIENALQLLTKAKRPCIVVGGGVLTSQASSELKQLAEKLTIPVTYTWNGKSAFADDHPLCVGSVGVGGSRAANSISSNADVILALGCRFSDWSASSFRKGVSFSIPPSRLIHVDIDPETIGRSYSTEVGIVADVKLTLADMVAGISERDSKTASHERECFIDEMKALKVKWEHVLSTRQNYKTVPGSMLAVLQSLRQVLPRQTVVTVGSGHCQASVKQGFPVYEPRTHITSGGFSTMGFAVPAAMASKVVNPDVPAVAILGDGDFLMSAHELATCVMQNLNVMILVLNNQGFMSIRDGQQALFDREFASEFKTRGQTQAPYSPDFVAMAKSFGVEFAHRTTDFDSISKFCRDALAHEGPALIEIPITRDPAFAGAEGAGWWDFPPMPDAAEFILHDYHAGISAQQHLGANTDDVEIVEPLGIYG